jgi:hypothetical protein
MLREMEAIRNKNAQQVTKQFLGREVMGKIGKKQTNLLAQM